MIHTYSTIRTLMHHSQTADIRTFCSFGQGTPINRYYSLFKIYRWLEAWDSTQHRLTLNLGLYFRNDECIKVLNNLLKNFLPFQPKMFNNGTIFSFYNINKVLLGFIKIFIVDIYFRFSSSSSSSNLVEFISLLPIGVAESLTFLQCNWN